MATFGINLSGPLDHLSELPYVDLFRQSRPWVSRREGSGQGPALDLDANGWVKRLESGCFAEAPMCTFEPGHYPSGTYTVLYDGDGEIEFNVGGKVIGREPGKLQVQVDSKNGGLFLGLKKTNSANYVRNIRVILPGFENQYQSNPWNPVFLNFWQGFSCFRFMDCMATNGSPVKKWGERPTPSSATFCKNGTPVELMVDLCNRTGADAWFCMPHMADDDYVRQFAMVVGERVAASAPQGLPGIFE